MRIVAIDTSARVGSVALQEGRDLICEVTVGMERKHCERLMPAVQWAMAAAGWEGDSVDVVATTHGPGPFTAIRVGVTAAKSLAYGWGAGAVAFPTPDAVARGYQHLSRPLHVLFDARKQEVYSARYIPDDASGFLVRRGDVECCAMEEALRDADPGTLYVGDGAIVYRDIVERLGGDGSALGEVGAASVRAGAVAALAFEAGPPALGGDHVHALAPLYVRRPEAVVRAERARSI